MGKRAIEQISKPFIGSSNLSQPLRSSLSCGPVYSPALGPAASNCCTGGISCFFSKRSSGTVPNGPAAGTRTGLATLGWLYTILYSAPLTLYALSAYN